MAVIVVLSILSLIAVVSYGEWDKRVAQQEVQSDLINAATAMENARNFSNGYPLSLPSSFKKSPGVNLSYKTGGTATAFCLNASSVRVPTVTYYLNSATDNKTPVAGVCP